MKKFPLVREQYVTKIEFDRELLLINTSLKEFNAHIITSNMLSSVINEKLAELKNLILGEGANSLRNKVDHLEKKEATRRNHERFLIIFLSGTISFCLTLIISIGPITKFMTHMAKLY